MTREIRRQSDMLEDLGSESPQASLLAMCPKTPPCNRAHSVRGAVAAAREICV